MISGFDSLGPKREAPEAAPALDHPSQAKAATIRITEADLLAVVKQGGPSTAAEAALALDRQEGGDHYKDMPIQPAQYIHANALGYFEGNVVKYVSRWRKKNGVEDLKKARHYIDLLLDLETKRAQ